MCEKIELFCGYVIPYYFFCYTISITFFIMVTVKCCSADFVGTVDLEKRKQLRHAAIKSKAILDSDNVVFLVIKEHSCHKPSYALFKQALVDLKNLCLDRGIHSVSFQDLAYRFRDLRVEILLHYIKQEFDGTEILFYICDFENTKQFLPDIPFPSFTVE